MPKVELHVHLEGSIRPSTLLKLAARRRVRLPANDVAGLREWFQFQDFEHFVQIYLTCSRCLRDPEDFQWIVLDFMEEQARQNILYTEAHFTVGTHLKNGVNGIEVGDALIEAVQEGSRRYDVELMLITDIVRDVGPGPADYTLEWAIQHREGLVVGVGLSGFETSPDEPYVEHFEVARREGLATVAHAGEHSGPESIRSAIKNCQAQRIGHGIRVLEDPELVDELVRLRIPLEVCPTSNVCLGAATSLAEHPFEAMRAAGLAVSVNSDDPPLFNTTLSEEYARLAETFGYGRAELAELAAAPVHHAFLSFEKRDDLQRRFEERLSRLEA